MAKSKTTKFEIELNDGIGYPHKFIVGKSPRVRKDASKDKTAC